MDEISLFCTNFRSLARSICLGASILYLGTLTSFCIVSNIVTGIIGQGYGSQAALHWTLCVHWMQVIFFFDLVYVEMLEKTVHWLLEVII